MPDLELERTSGDRRLYAFAAFVVRGLAENAGGAAAAGSGAAASGG